jgi:uncharacterized coiled-coil DUF342 family protein
MKQARYETVKMRTDEEKHLLARIEELEERLDQVSTAVNNHQHIDGKVLIATEWVF